MISPSDTLMYHETAETAAVIERALAHNAARLAALGQQLRAQPPRFIVTCARGSSDHAATYAKYVFETHLGLATASASPAIASIYEARLKLNGALFIAISQSGKSPDLLRSAQAAREAGAHVLALVNVENSPLARLADTFIPLHAGPELSVAATKSYLATLVAVLQLVAHWSHDAGLHEALTRLPTDLQRAWHTHWDALAGGLREAHQLFIIGRGYGFGTALEAALKLKETCGLHAEAFSAAELKHGPMALINKGFPLLFLVQNDASMASTLGVAKEMLARGARTFIAAPSACGVDTLPLPDDVAPVVTPLLAIHNFYRTACALSLLRGHNPDLPPHLNKITATV